MAGSRSELERVLERRRAVALAQHYRYEEGLSIAQIADRLGRSPATIKAYFYDPTGEEAPAVKARYVGLCRGCGAYTQPRNGKGDAYRYCIGVGPARSSGSGRESCCSRPSRMAGHVRTAPIFVEVCRALIVALT